MKKILIWMTFLFSIHVFANNDDLKVSDQSRELLDKSDGAQFTIEKNLVERLFSQTVSDHSSFEENAVLMEVGFGQFYPKDMDLKNKYYTIYYKENLASLSMVSAAFTKPFFQGKLGLFLKTGYAFAQGIFNVHGESGLEHSDSVSVQWVLLQAGVSVEILSLGFLKLKSQFGAGEDFFTQTGTLDGINQNFIIPHAFGGASISLFEKNNQSGFEGVSLTSNYQKSFHEEQTIKGWSFTLASRFVL